MSLHQRRRPSTVTRLVVTRRIRVAIQCVLRAWSWSHISEERLKVFPPIAYGDSLAAVIRVVVSVLVEAASKHCHPRSMFEERGRTVCARTQAPAALCVPLFQLRAVEHFLCSALTSTDNAVFRGWLPRSFADHGQAPKYLTYETRRGTFPGPTVGADVFQRSELSRARHGAHRVASGTQSRRSTAKRISAHGADSFDHVGIIRALGQSLAFLEK